MLTATCAFAVLLGVSKMPAAIAANANDFNIFIRSPLSTRTNARLPDVLQLGFHSLECE